MEALKQRKEQKKQKQKQGQGQKNIDEVSSGVAPVDDQIDPGLGSSTRAIEEVEKAVNSLGAFIHALFIVANSNALATHFQLSQHDDAYDWSPPHVQVICHRQQASQ